MSRIILTPFTYTEWYGKESVKESVDEATGEFYSVNEFHSVNGQQSHFGVSQTVPDQSYTIQELLERFTSGTMPPVSLLGEYYGEEEPDPTRSGAYDLADYTEDSLRLAERLAEAKTAKKRSEAKAIEPNEREAGVEPEQQAQASTGEPREPQS